MHRRTFLTAGAAALLLPDASLRAGGHGRVGTFTGPARYGVAGRGEIAGRQVNLLADFRLGRGPDPKVALGRGGYDPATLMGPLNAMTGASSYAVPAGIDPAGYDEIWIWCERFSVPLGHAKLG